MKRQIELTDAQRGVLVALIQREAARLGWRTKYHEWNKSDWPYRLKQLGPIFEQLRPQRTDD